MASAWYLRLWEWLCLKKERWLLAVLLCLSMLCLLAFLLWPKGSDRPSSKPAEPAAMGSASSSQQQPAKKAAVKEKQAGLQVDLKGAVQQPGLYQLAAGARVQDLLKKAGGLTATADEDRINRAQPLVDGTVVYICQRGEQAPAGLTGPAPSAANSDQGTGSGPVNLNTATAKELESLNGIGPKKAEQIVAYRESHGPFQKIADLAGVPGLGPKRLAALAEQVTL
ncbi:ComEA family DNA-binding protein [Leuconostocaceae bacterium ESL0958]|nr:ComEA family DNA-binding protein [Leuconostocaceae bacterium ESL0958]